MAYDPFDPTRPESATDTGTSFDDKVRAQDLALRDGLVAGSTGGWAYSVSGGTADQPAVKLWINGVYRIRATFTYAGDVSTSILWEYSSNSGSLYSTMWTQTATYDVDGNITSGNNQDHATAMLYELAGKVRGLLAVVDALSGGVSAFGTMAAQDADAVAVVGGTVKNTPLGGTGASEAALATVTALHVVSPDLGTILAAGTATCNLAAGDHFKMSPAGNWTLAFSNPPASGFSVCAILEVVNAAGKTMTLPSGWSWGAAGAPTWTSGTDYVTAISRNAGSGGRLVYGSAG